MGPGPLPLARSIRAIADRWPGVAAHSQDAPVFVFCAGPCSGEDGFAKAISSDCRLTFDRCEAGSPLKTLADQLVPFSESWPPDSFFVSGETSFPLNYQPRVNLYPELGSLIESQLAFFERLYAAPARRAGMPSWGVVSLFSNAGYAYFVRLLYPKAKIIFLFRDPWESFNQLSSSSWDKEPQMRLLADRMDAASYATCWSQSVTSFQEHHGHLAARVVPYEQIQNPGMQMQLQELLGFKLSPRPEVVSNGTASVGAEPGGLDPIVGEIASGLGYRRRAAGHEPSGPEQSQGPDPEPGIPAAHFATRESNAKCVVLVPYADHIQPQCERSLRALESRGYVVRRVPDFTAIDVARNVLATQALDDGFEEILWVDDDTNFSPDSVDRLRGHGEPIVGALVAKRGQRSFASMFNRDTERILLGASGGIIEVLQMGTGFLLTHRSVYQSIEQHFHLPRCTEKSGLSCIPFFMPSIIPSDDGQWYLAEDYSFINRARACGYRILADTAIRIGHIGNYEYSWEDVGIAKPRFESFVFNV